MTMCRAFTSFGLCLAVLLGQAPSAAPSLAADPKEMSKDIIAVQIRKQGYDCKNPESAERDVEASKPDSEVWVLKCEGASYRVHLIPNMAATVETLAGQ
jgi:hypothetical protein